MRHPRKLGFESLENRRLLAVTVSNTPAGDLLIAGDFAADSIIITENELGTQWEIGGIGTTVTPQVPDVDPVRPGLQILKPTTQNVLIQLGSGNDSLRMVNINQGSGANAVTFVGQTTIEMGSESDSVLIGRHPNELNIIPVPVNPGGPTDSNIIMAAQQGSGANDFIGAVSIHLGPSDNELFVRNTDFGHLGSQAIAAVGGQLKVHGGQNVDTVNIDLSNNFGGSFDISTNEGEDVVNVGQHGAVTLGGNLNVSTGDGSDSVWLELALTAGSITVNGGPHDDTIRLGSPLDTPLANRVGSSAQRDILIQGDHGFDSVTVNQATTVGALHVALGSGPTVFIPGFGIRPGNLGNVLSVHNSSFSDVSSISAENGEDGVTLNAVNAPLGLHIQTSGGNDIVRILGTLVELGVASVVTGGGDDVVQIGGGTRIETLSMSTGDHNDTVAFGNSENVAGNASVAEFFLDLGAGDDTVDSADSTFGRAIVQGGAGMNTRRGQAFGQDNEADFLFFDGFGV
jgi:hypothetical protein